MSSVINSRDKETLEFIYARMLEAHKENPMVDYMISLKKMIESSKEKIEDFSDDLEGLVGKKIRCVNVEWFTNEDVYDIIPTYIEPWIGQRLVIKDKCGDDNMYSIDELIENFELINENDSEWSKLTKEERLFVSRVLMKGDGKYAASPMYSEGDALWRNPEKFGFIKSVGSYRFEICDAGVKELLTKEEILQARPEIAF